jgi:hypothetical protein
VFADGSIDFRVEHKDKIHTAKLASIACSGDFFPNNYVFATAYHDAKSGHEISSLAQATSALSIGSAGVCPSLPS